VIPRARVLLISTGLALGFASSGRAQNYLTITARTPDGLPLAEAVVMTAPSGLTTRTDRLGRARFADLARPATVIVLYVGFVPDTLTANQGDTAIVAVLLPRAPTLADLTVFSGEDLLTPSMTGQWVMPRQVLEELPVAVEPDPLRALSLVPSVSFSSPLSARPLLRGYDADESVVRLDGHEMTSPYHIARAFSGIPTDALDRATVSSAAADPATGGTLAGSVDLFGRGPSGDAGVHGGIAASPVSLTAWHAGNAAIPVFAALRLGFLEKFSGLLKESIPYRFHDAYVHSHLTLPAAMALELTGYSAGDRVGATAGQGMNWTNDLAGARLRVADRPAYTVDIGGSTSRFSMTGRSLPIRGSLVDLTNQVNRAGLSATMDLGARRRYRIGAGLTVRGARTGISKLSGDDAFPPNESARLVEYQAFVDGSASLCRVTIEGGARLDASAHARALQPRVRVAAPLGRSLTGSVSYTRASRLFHVLSDPQPEPQLLFPQFWLTAGAGGTPVPVVDHVSASIDWETARWRVSSSAYASRGRGIGELRPEADATTGAGAFRFGDSRTAGVELRVTRATGGGSPPLFAVTYVLSWSDRRFESGRWRPWQLDRRHLVRLQLSKAARERWLFFATGEYQSGQPLTRVADVVHTDMPPVDASDQPGTGRFAYHYAEENSSRSAGTLRFDVGAQLRMRGPGRSRLSLRASVINAGFGPVAPQAPVPAGDLPFLTPAERQFGVPYKRAFSLPAIPTITARLEF
jgi:hypothetical protein